MNTPGQFSDKRRREHDYSKPGTYHLRLKVAEHSSTLGTMRKGGVILNEYGEEFLSVLGMALQVFTCLRIDAMDVRPQCVELVVTVLTWRKAFCALFKSLLHRWHYRRTMTISVFVGYLKMNSARRINKLRGVDGVRFWTLGFQDRVLTDQEEIDQLCLELNTRFHRMRCSARPVIGKERAVSLSSVIASTMSSALHNVFGALSSSVPALREEMEGHSQLSGTMLLGRALFLNSSLLHPDTTDDDTDLAGGDFALRASGGRTREPLIWSVGPGRIFLSGPPDR